MSKRWLVIQEHLAERAGFHLDVRFEVDQQVDSETEYAKKRPNSNEPSFASESKVLRSFVIPKGRLPNIGEKLLVVPTEDHPWDYRLFDGEIAEGYGKGHVTLRFSAETEVEIYDTSVKFIYKEVQYKLFNAGEIWLIMRCKQ